MNFKKMLKRLQKLLDAEAREHDFHREDLKRLLRKMKLKEKSLTEKATTETDSENLTRLNKKIDMLHAQRKKGIQALKDLPPSL